MGVLVPFSPHLSAPSTPSNVLFPLFHAAEYSSVQPSPAQSSKHLESGMRRHVLVRCRVYAKVPDDAWLYPIIDDSLNLFARHYRDMTVLAYSIIVLHYTCSCVIFPTLSYSL